MITITNESNQNLHAMLIFQILLECTASTFAIPFNAVENNSVSHTLIVCLLIVYIFFHFADKKSGPLFMHIFDDYSDAEHI